MESKTKEITLGAQRFLINMGYACLTELTLKFARTAAKRLELDPL